MCVSMEIGTSGPGGRLARIVRRWLRSTQPGPWQDEPASAMSTPEVRGPEGY